MSEMKLGCGMLLAALVLTGCSKSDGSKELANGWEAYRVHNLKKASQLFEKSVAKNAENVDALVASARVKLELGEIAAAKETLTRAAALADTDADVILLGAQIAYHAKDYKQAVEAYSRFAEDVQRDAKLRADALIGLAVVEMTCNNNDSARVALLRALLLDRRSAPARYHLGLLYRNLDYDEAALEQMEAYVMLDATADLRAQRVQRQIIPGLKESIAKKATERPGVDKRNSAEASKNLQKAEAEWKKGNYKKAKAWYADALKADPLSYPAAFGLAQAWEKTDTSATGKRNALACYQTACALKPGAIKTLMKTGSLAASLGSQATATEAYSRALVADPKNIDAIDCYIRALRKQGSGGAKTAALWQTYRNQLKK